MEISLVSRSAVLSFDSSALKPDFKILKYNSIFQRCLYHSSTVIASNLVLTGKFVMNVQRIFSRSVDLLKFRSFRCYYPISDEITHQ